jgi:hypothetical protein
VAISVSTWVWEHSGSRHGARLVLLKIADGMRTENGWAWPSVKDLCAKTKLMERAVRAAISELEILGELEVQRNAGPGGCSRYRIVAYPCKDCTCIFCTPPANSAPPQSSLLDGLEGADFAGAEFAGVQKTTLGGAENAPGTVKNRKTSSSKKNVGDPEPQRDDVDRICAHLAERIVANGSKRPTITEAWKREARLLLDADKRTEEQVHKAIDWCQGNRFWRSKVMSVAKLRDKYDTFRLDAEAERDKANGNGPRRSNMRGGGAADPLTDQVYGQGETTI